MWIVKLLFAWYLSTASRSSADLNVWCDVCTCFDRSTVVSFRTKDERVSQNWYIDLCLSKKTAIVSSSICKTIIHCNTWMVWLVASALPGTFIYWIPNVHIATSRGCGGPKSREDGQFQTHVLLALSYPLARETGRVSTVKRLKKSWKSRGNHSNSDTLKSKLSGPVMGKRL